MAVRVHKAIISRFQNKNILVVGDVILDRYIQGSVSRISPEAPVPVVLEETSVYQPGGAANVAHNLAVLGARVSQIGRIGNDFEGKLLKRALKNKAVDTEGLFLDKSVSTITKTRVIARNQQVVRIDKEVSGEDLQGALLSRIHHFILDKMDAVDAVIISDYGKGMITPDLAAGIISAARERGIPVTVDPKVEHFRSYRDVTCITPNLKEAENAIRNIKIRENDGGALGVNTDKLLTFSDIEDAGLKLLEYLNLESLLITLGEHGMRLFEKGKSPYAIDTRAREVFDVTGAGDAVISVFTLALTAGATKRQAAELANDAAGVVVGKMGAAAVTPEELIEAVKKREKF